MSSMGHWFRFYDSALEDPKVQRLPAGLFKFWINVLCLASKHGGVIPPVDDVSFSLRMTESQAVEMLESLSAVGLIDETTEGLIPHNWQGRQFKSDVSTERVQRFRKRQRNVSETASETAPEQIQSQKQIQKDSESCAVADATRTSADVEKHFEEFWRSYPKRGDASNPRKPAREKFVRAVKAGSDPSEIIAGARRYADCERMRKTIGTDKIAQAVTWLNQERWMDYPATAPPSAPTGVLVRTDTPQWDAWQAHLKAKTGKGSPCVNGGWRFPTEWPPEKEVLLNGGDHDRS